MHGYLSRDGLRPTELLSEGRREVLGYGVRLVCDLVTVVAPGAASRFEVHSATGGPLAARRVLLATGLRDLLPDIPGVAERWGRDLLHCPYCHGYEVRDQPLEVLGGSPGAVQHALLVRQWSSDVLFFPHTDALEEGEREQLAARGITVVEGAVAALATDDDQLCGVELGDGRFIPRPAAFVRPRMVPAQRCCPSCAPRWTRVAGRRSTRKDVPRSTASGSPATQPTPAHRSSRQPAGGKRSPSR